MHDEILLDAARKKDGTQVLLKLWSQSVRDGAELGVLEYLSGESRGKDPANHCIPLLETLTIPGWSRFFDRVLFEPLLRCWKEPPFVMGAEGLAFMLQALEGLEYMHAHNVAHGDVHSGNILMDPIQLFPDGFHGGFTLNPRHRMPEKRLKRLTKIQAPVKYYYVDFGSISIFSNYEERKLVHPIAAVWPVWVPPEYLDNRKPPWTLSSRTFWRWG